MKAIETNITVSTDGRVLFDLALPVEVSPGTHGDFIVIEEQLVERMPSRDRLKFSTHPVGPVPADCAYRREDIYGDDGR